ncbi:MAG: phosphopantothenoylcysteine decarboxylase [Candidatus Omnitrophota bacterium]|jgi:phosphopantothenoylcysteine decarboxylase/phosphopantothenate--cysteine ligase
MKILITAGPTWIKLDDVRVITTIFSGKTGIFLAKNFKNKGHSVTLLVNSPYLNKAELKGIKIIPFKYFEDFKKRITDEVTANCYDAIIHSAAVADYRLGKIFKGKIPSAKKPFALKLVPAEKIIKIIRSFQKQAILIQFKLEIKRKGLLKEAFKSLNANRSNFVVANALEDLKLGYKSFLIDTDKNIISISSKKSLFDNLEKVIKG